MLSVALKSPTPYKIPISPKKIQEFDDHVATKCYTKRERGVLDPNMGHSPPNDFKLMAIFRLANY